MNRIILLVLLLLGIGGGGGVYWFFLRPPPIPETPEQTTARLRKEAEEKEKERMNAPPVWHDLGSAPVPAPIYLNGKVRAYMFFGFRLDLAKAEVGPKLDVAGPQLSERLLLEFSDHPVKMIEGTNNPDLAEVKARVKEMVEEEYGKETVNDVLINLTYLQPF